MLGLKLNTDSRWANIAENNLENILSDHAWCEQKAASNAIHLIAQNPEREELVSELLLVAQEELDHFAQVHQIIKERGYKLAREQKDNYVGQLMKLIQKGGSRDDQLVERLLFAAMIEARSCERFRLLSESLKDEKLADFYRELMISEASHYKLFLNFAKKYADKTNVEKRWKEWLEGEAKIIAGFGKSDTIHG